MTSALPPEEFRIEQHVREDGATVIALFGDVDLATVPSVEAALADHATHQRPAVLDLGGVAFMDSTGLNLIIRMAQESARDGWTFALADRLPDAVARLFDVTGVHGQLPFDG
jgi:anti-anti-sigma factor